MIRLFLGNLWRRWREWREPEEPDFVARMRALREAR